MNNDIRIVPWGKDHFAVLRANINGNYIDAYRTESWDKPVLADLLAVCLTQESAAAVLRLLTM